MRTRLLAVPLIAVAIALLGGCATGSVDDVQAEASGCGYVEDAGAVREVTAPPAEPTVSGEVTATLATSAGDLALTLDAERTPCTVGSFVSLAAQHYFDDTVCHRLTTHGIFVLQCGDPSGTGMGGPGYRFTDELDGSETYPAGTVAMANAGPNTNGSQFFLVYDESPLPPNYTVFGTLDDPSLATLRQIATKGTQSGAPDGPPLEPVTITAVTVG